MRQPSPVSLLVSLAMASTADAVLEDMRDRGPRGPSAREIAYKKQRRKKNRKKRAERKRSRRRR